MLLSFVFVKVRLCEKDDSWKPLLLIVPLRLGLSEVNPIYINCIKKSFEIPGTVGMVGGRPNQALYFIGYVGDEALYLDPHTTQKCGSIGDKTASSEIELDETYHQKYAARINFKNMDPSLALVCTNKMTDMFTMHYQAQCIFYTFVHSYHLAIAHILCILSYFSVFCVEPNQNSLNFAHDYKMICYVREVNRYLK